MSYPLLPSPAICRREDFGDLLNLRRLAGVAVEIGTHRADFAVALLSRWKGRRLCCVDPWQTDMPDYVDVVNEGDRQKDLAIARARLAPFGPRVEFFKMTSAEAATRFEPESLDFVYIDGNHHRKYVRQDVNLWYFRLKSGGVLAGHDINGDWADEVRPVVVGFALKIRQPVYIVPGDAASWYLVKP